MPRVPPAAIAPDASLGLYPHRIMIGADMIPKTVTAAPTIPVAMAKTVAVRTTPK